MRFLTPANWIDSAVNIMILTDETAGHIHLLRVLRRHKEELYRTGSVVVISEAVPGHSHDVTLLFAGGVISLGSIAGNHGHGLDLQIGSSGVPSNFENLVENGVSTADESGSLLNGTMLVYFNHQMSVSSLKEISARFRIRENSSALYSTESGEAVVVRSDPAKAGVKLNMGDLGTIQIVDPTYNIVNNTMAAYIPVGINCKVTSISVGSGGSGYYDITVTEAHGWVCFCVRQGANPLTKEAAVKDLFVKAYY